MSMETPESPDPLKGLRALGQPPYPARNLERLVEAMRTLPAADLDRLTLALDLSGLLRRGPRVQTRQILALLSHDRVGDLSVAARGRLVDALQIGPTPRRFEKAIRDCLLATHGTDLSALKRAIDAGSSHWDMLELLYHDIDSVTIRKEVLDHLIREGNRATERDLKILSDVDDTLYANWVDKRYPPKTVYPGVLQLYLELDRGLEDRPSPPGDVAFLTGRPGGPCGLFEDRYHGRLEAKGLHDTVLLTGSLVHQFIHRLILARKWANFERFQAIYPEYDFVLFGDSGQADPGLLAGLVRAHPGRIRAAMIHDVVRSSESVRRDWAERGVFFFDTYTGAAAELVHRGLLDPAAARRVLEAARGELADIPFADPAQRAARQAELERDARLVE